MEEAPESQGGQGSKASLFTCVGPRLWKGCEVGPHVAMGKGRPWNCKGVRSLRGGWSGRGAGPWAKGGSAECLPISSVAPFQGPRFPLLL